ncbi:AAA family ATPase [Streptomyces cyaneus]|uniref:AAA family ATPase n=1 Tax=Streptomyces cyaneus TaxID=1904 RepID=UPI000FF8A507|nr:AAA family ATPase [Streptomyces cyaneus]
MSGSDPRRFLIATAVSHYPHAPEWDRPGLVEARREIVELFTTKLGYEHVSDLGANPTQHQLLREIREFCRSPERRPDDIVAVYLTAHGELLRAEDEYVLLTSDTRPEDLHDALQPDLLVRKILAGTKVRRLLLMLDTCYSGQGGNELLAAMAKLKSNWREQDAGLAVITSTQPYELARTGAFPELLSEAVTSLATAGYTPELLALDAVVNATRNNPKRPDHQRIGLEIIGLTGEIPPFLPNAKHSRQLSHTDLALQRAAEWDEQDKRRDVEFRTRLLRRAMGHRDEDRVGWWFSGRHRALTDITGWLGELPDDRPALVVTGDPGSGKTAVLGLLAAVSDPEYRRTVPLSSLGLSAELLPAPRAIRTAVYAQNLTDQQVLNALAAALRLPQAETVADLLNHLNAGPESDRPRVVLIDGLDEAATPNALCGQVLRPLMELAGARLRLLLGTRPHLLAALGLEREDQVDLDSPRYADPQAVLAYAVRNLIDAHPKSPYLDCGNGLRFAVAQAVAAAAGHSFLVARITAGTLAATPTLPDPGDAGWRRSLPSAAADAVHRDLHQRFGAGAARILDLLRPLAYAEGQGLPWEDIWAPVASGLSGRPYTNEDLHQLRRDAGAYVVEAVEDGRSVYRLYHEAMAEYLRQGQDAGSVHRGFTAALRRAVPYQLDGSPDWGRAHPYALRHLATHAVHAGLLDDLVADLDYLVHANCDTLAVHLLRAGSDAARLHAAIYLASVKVHRDLGPEGRRRVLAVDAARCNVPSVLEELNGKVAGRVWRPFAASGSEVSANVHSILLSDADGGGAVATAVLDGRPVVVAGSADGTVRVWDLTTGRPLGQPLSGHTEAVSAVACAELDRAPIAVTGAEDGTVLVWDLTACRPLGEPLTGHTSGVTAVACAELDHGPIAVTASGDRTVRVWDLTTGRFLGKLGEHARGVSSVACAVVRGKPVAVTSDSGNSLRVWDLATLRERGRLQGDGEIWVLTLVCTEVDGRPVAVGSAYDETVRLWDLETGELLAQRHGPEDWAMAVACAELHGRPVAITASYDSTFRIWDLKSHELVGPPLGGRLDPVHLAPASVGGQLVAVTGCFDDTLRVWDLSPRQAVGRPVLGHTKDVQAMDLAVLRDRPVVVTGADDRTVRVWDLATGLPVGEPMGEHTSEVWSVACTLLGDRPVAVTSCLDDTVRVWDLETGQAACPPLTTPGDFVTQLACTVLDGRPVVVGGTLEAVWVWELPSGRAVHPPLRRHRAPVRAVACTLRHGRPVAVTGAEDWTVRMWDLTTGRPIGEPERGLWTRAIACTLLDDLPVAVICSRDGSVRVWDLETGLLPLGPPMTGHTDAVVDVACTVLDGRPVAVTASRDSTIRVWDLDSFSTVEVIQVPGPCTALTINGTGLLACAFGSDVAVFARR